MNGLQFLYTSKALGLSPEDPVRRSRAPIFSLGQRLASPSRCPCPAADELIE
jgi:hypothetical protein